MPVDFYLYYPARRALIAYVLRLAEVLSVKTAHCERDRLCKCSKPAPPGTWLFSRTKRKLPHISLICVDLRHMRLRSFCSAFWLWLRRTKSLRLTPLECSKPAPPGTWLFWRTKRKLPHISLICVDLRHLRLRSFCSAFWLWLRRTKSLRLTPLECSKPAPPGTWLFWRTKRKLPH